MLRLKSVSKGYFQINQEYDLQPISERSIGLLQSQGQSQFSAVIRSKHTGVGKMVCSQTANLLMLLQEQEMISEDFLASKDLEVVLARFVLDDILRIHWNGQFMGGPSAWVALFEGEIPEPKRNCLSIAALRYAQALRLGDTLQLSRRMYAYNCAPVTCFWRKRIPDCEAVLRFIGGNSAKRQLAHSHGWLAWQVKNWQWQQDKPLYKLYLSPQIIALEECWQKALPVFHASNAVALKIGADAYGLLRPDKIVAHFECQEALMETADELEKSLDGFPAQGVPFTAALDKAGLLSWGADLPSTNQESWRSWITYRLANAIIAASQVNLPIEPWQYAMERLQLDGVNTRDWMPTQMLLQ